MRGAPRELNYGAMIQSIIIRIVERILTIKDLIKRLVNDPLFRFDCCFLVSDKVSSEEWRRLAYETSRNQSQSVNL